MAVLGNDATWGIDHAFQLAYHGRAVATDLRPVRYRRLMTALGGHGENIEQAAERAGARLRRRPARAR